MENFALGATSKHRSPTNEIEIENVLLGKTFNKYTQQQQWTQFMIAIKQPFNQRAFGLVSVEVNGELQQNGNSSNNKSKQQQQSHIVKTTMITNHNLNTTLTQSTFCLHRQDNGQEQQRQKDYHHQQRQRQHRIRTESPRKGKRT